MRPRLLLALVLGLAACSQDPYKLREYGDGGSGTGDGGWQDAIVHADARKPDSTPDVRPFQDMTFDACRVQTEVCNNADDNCDGQIDEGLDKLGDVRYCDGCKGCKDLLAKNAFPACQAGKCTIGSCQAGWIDFDKDASNGCEFKCTPTGVEICDGVDNDCNQKIDDNVKAPTGICKNLGPCAGAAATCKGKDGWQCQYGGAVELQPCTTDPQCGAGNKCVGGFCPNVVIADEKRCDGVDGDCDGLADDPWTNQSLPTAIGKECDVDNPPKKGICRSVGEFACDASGTKTSCKLKTAGRSPGAELCNGLDDDCNGTVDDNVTDEQWVPVAGTPAFQIFKYEASRPDATAGAAGIDSNGRPCSVAKRLPWGSVTKEDALAACRRVGARLCTKAEWESACKGFLNAKFPYGDAFQPNTCNGRAYDSNPGTPANDDEALVTDQPTACVSTVAGGQVLNLSGNLKEWIATSYSGQTPAGYAIKGGAYDTPSIADHGDGLSCTYDLPAPGATLQLPTLGFRCCK
ncbi:MAG: SUMF1/EgtB/PvdO family nonheme iron enzyme [Deltaproteobacteria bacterium]|nr:SUMF1/EgtB/PvdO family nonheme iron enzyme [Deltaproteobacteria bacterium]